MPTRDFSYVEDTVSGFIAALQSENGIGEVYNLGSNFEISIGKTVEMIAGLMGKDIQIASDEQRLRPIASEVERLWADNTKANQLLGWTPKYKGIEGFRDGLKQTIEWFVEPKNLLNYKSDIYNL
jgi:dTDP-glucose 4,6-dehydratase